MIAIKIIDSRYFEHGPSATRDVQDSHSMGLLHTANTDEIALKSIHTHAATGRRLGMPPCAHPHAAIHSTESDTLDMSANYMWCRLHVRSEVVHVHAIAGKEKPSTLDTGCHFVNVHAIAPVSHPPPSAVEARRHTSRCLTL